MMENSIDVFRFEDLRDNVPSPRERLEMFTRNGFDGHGARKVGFRSESLQMRSIRFEKDWEAARLLLKRYQELIGVGPVSIVQHDHFFGSYFVSEVIEVRTVAVTSTGGTIIQDPSVMMECRWSLWG